MRIEQTAAASPSGEGESARRFRRTRSPVVDNSALIFVAQYNLQQHRHDRRSDGDIQISLKEDMPDRRLRHRLRSELPRRFPGTSFSFLPAESSVRSSIFGAPARSICRSAKRSRRDFAYANKRWRKVRHVTGWLMRASSSPRPADARRQHRRTRAQYTGVTAATHNSLVVNLASSARLAPVYWLTRKTALPIRLLCRRRNTRSTRCRVAKSADQCSRAPTHAGRIANSAQSQHAVVSNTTSHRWWRFTRPSKGVISARLQRDPEDHRTERPDSQKGAIVAFGRPDGTMNSAYSACCSACLAHRAVYLLIVINFQSWSDPLSSSLRCLQLSPASCGCCSRRTRHFCAALTGAIMCMGVATPTVCW